MTCDQLRPDYVTFALGILDDPERSEITEHLLRKCENCVPGIASAMATVSAMSGAVKISEPPKDLRRRVVAMVARDAQDQSGARPPKRAWAIFCSLGNRGGACSCAAHHHRFGNLAVEPAR